MTSPYLAAVFLYWAVSVILSFGTMLWWMLACRESDESPLWIALAELGSPRREATIVGMTIMCVLLAPVVVPYCVLIFFRLLHQDRAELRYLLRTHREFVFEPLHPARLPETAKSYFDERRPDLLTLGFSNQGTFMLKPEPGQLVGTCFHGPDSRTIAVLGENCNTPHLSFTTLFENGGVLETTCEELHRHVLSFNPNDSYQAVSIPGASVAATYARHVQEVDGLEDAWGVPALAFRAGQFREVLTYEGRAFSRALFALGKRDARAPEPVLPDPLPPGSDPKACQAGR